jgi:hypothetical protein
MTWRCECGVPSPYGPGVGRRLQFAPTARTDTGQIAGADLPACLGKRFFEIATLRNDVGLQCQPYGKITSFQAPDTVDNPIVIIGDGQEVSFMAAPA